MASLIGPSRYMRSRKLKTNARTPINAAVAEWQERQRQGNPPKAKAEAVPPPEFGPPVDPRTLPEAWRANREAVCAWAWGGTVDRHFRLFLAGRRCPLDDWVVFLELARAWAEALYLTVAAMPDARRRPCLPGCRGTGPDGGPCPNLRVWGAGFCPEHQEIEDDQDIYVGPRNEAEARKAGLSITRRR
jgi:hypothetical protein